MTSAITVAAIQMVSSASVASNLATAARLIADAATLGAQLVALPEYFCLMGQRDTDKLALAEVDSGGNGGGPLQDFLRDSAVRHRIVLIGGTIPLSAEQEDKVRNTTLVFDADGKRLAHYDKIHLFGFQQGAESFDEARTIAPGHTPVTFQARFGDDEQPLHIGLSICYDLRFPELFRALSDDGKTQLMLVPSAFTATTGRAHWEVLLRARAIENQCYILAPAQGGLHDNGRQTWGHSMLIDPWGTVQAERAEGEGIVIGKIDPSYIEEVRAKLPALKHRVL